MLNASAACLGTTPDDSPALSEARKRLAEASSDLAAFFAATWRVKCWSFCFLDVVVQGCGETLG
jgi:hypothetical protein